MVRIDDMNGTNWTTFGSLGSGVNQFNLSRSLSLDFLGRIYVDDSVNCRVVRIDDMTGANWKTFGTFGSGNNNSARPGAFSCTEFCRPEPIGSPVKAKLA